MTTVSILPDDDDPDGWTEVVDGNVPRVDLVGKAANGAPRFLLMKADSAGLLDPSVVRDLVKEATPEPDPERNMTALTISGADHAQHFYTGSPRDVMAAIHKASITSKETPMPETAILTKADDAAQAADAVVGDTEPLPDADQTATGATDGADGGGVPTPAPGDPDDPSSPAWEAVDAARARQALQLTIALQRLVAQSAAREAQEAATGDDCGDAENVWTLEDVGYAIDAIVAMLAPYAITEQAEADQGTADASDAMTKGAEPMTKGNAAALIKSGRVLSSANEAKIRGAADALQAVLSSLPAPTDDAAPVAKEGAPMTEPVVKTAQERHDDALTLLAKAATEKDWRIESRIEKAKGDPQMAVFDADGTLVGTIDPGDLSPIAAPAPPDGDTAAPADDAAPVVQPDATDGPAADAVPAPTPVPPVDPADDPMKKAMDQIDLLKSTLTDAIKEALTPLEDRIVKMEAQPMPGGPMLNGATPGGDPVAFRGQDTGGDASALRKAWMDEADPIKKQELRTQLVLDGIRNAPPLR
jgi:hypothetical protein